MQIIINDNKRIDAFQKTFNDHFPYLKIEFFSKPHKVGGASPKNNIITLSKTLGECRIIHKSGSMTIGPHMSVAELEQNFHNIFGLSIQVFRKSGKVWLETTVTDQWTLEEQNRQGESLSKI